MGKINQNKSTSTAPPHSITIFKALTKSYLNSSNAAIKNLTHSINSPFTLNPSLPLQSLSAPSIRLAIGLTPLIHPWTRSEQHDVQKLQIGSSKRTNLINNPTSASPALATPQHPCPQLQRPRLPSPIPSPFRQLEEMDKILLAHEQSPQKAAIQQILLKLLIEPQRFEIFIYSEPNGFIKYSIRRQ